jgi:hypothetical protein
VSELVLKRLGKTIELPAMLCNFDITFEEGKCIFTEAPEVFGWLARNWWRFAACGWDGRPKGLEFVGGEGEGEGRE